MGFPSPAADYEENPLRLDDLVVHPAATYFIKMTGVAMESTIHAGDVMIVDNPAFVDIVIQSGDEDFLLWGVVTYAIHKLQAPTRRIRMKARK